MNESMGESCAPVCEACAAAAASGGAATATCDAITNLSNGLATWVAARMSTSASAEDNDNGCNETGGEGYYYGV